MPYEFIGGLRNGTMSSDQDVPDEVVMAGEPIVVKTPAGSVREIYELRDGKLMYVRDISPNTWKKNGDPCPVCDSTATHAIRKRRTNDGQYLELGSCELTEQHARMVTFVQCDRGHFSEVDPC